MFKQVKLADKVYQLRTLTDGHYECYIKDSNGSIVLKFHTSQLSSDVRFNEGERNMIREWLHLAI